MEGVANSAVFLPVRFDAHTAAIIISHCCGPAAIVRAHLVLVVYLSQVFTLTLFLLGLVSSPLVSMLPPAPSRAMLPRALPWLWEATQVVVFDPILLRFGHIHT